MKPLIRSTFSPQVATDVGAFGAMFSLAGIGPDAFLVSSADSVGTKVMVAAMMHRHDTVGECIVNHCVNDILVQGAKPLFFMDYIAASQLSEALLEQLITGLAAGCRKAGCALIGGETAELPGMYQPGQYDLVGFITGMVMKEKMVTGDGIRPGDVLLGLASDGLHTNGYSLARKLFFEVAGLPVDQHVPQLGRTLGEELLRVHRCYAPGSCPCSTKSKCGAWPTSPAAAFPTISCAASRKAAARSSSGRAGRPPRSSSSIQDLGRVPDEEMYHVFNMGIGYVLVVEESVADAAADNLTARGETVFRLGRIEPGDREVRIV